MEVFSVRIFLYLKEWPGYIYILWIYPLTSMSAYEDVTDVKLWINYTEDLFTEVKLYRTS